MRVIRGGEGETQQVESMSYRGQDRPVRGVEVRWLSKGDLDDCSRAGYGLRVFTMTPGAEIPIHSHRYAQTIYVLSGRFECWSFDPETEERVDSCVVKPGEAVYTAPWEPHGMRNAAEDESGTFLCCIGSWEGEAAGTGNRSD
jgi:quercetin dioxygenase-like cupin family protein